MKELNRDELLKVLGGDTDSKGLLTEVLMDID